MENPENEICEAILSGNFSQAVKLAEEWVRSIPLKSDPVLELSAADTFKIARFFQHRHERVGHMQAGREKARLFLGYLQELEARFSRSAGAEKSMVAARRYCHGQISSGLAKDFAGQKAYQLDQKEIIQLGISLIEIGNIPSALETFRFLLQMSPKSAEVNYLTAYCLDCIPDPVGMRECLRIALLLQPELVQTYPRYLPSGVFREIYNDLNESENDLRERYFAMLLELNGIYAAPWKIKDDEIARFQSDYLKLKREYENNSRLHDELKPRLLHYLCVLISANHEIKNLDAVEELREQMIDIDRSLWDTFQQKNLINRR